MTKTTKSIPKKLDDIFKEVKREVIWLHGRWITFRQLFGKSKERIDLLNECAPSFFFIIQNIFMDDIQLTLTKLSDRPQTRGKKKNLCLGLICKIVNELGENELSSNLKASLLRYRKFCETFKKHRDKRIAHFDLTTHLDEKSKPLPGVSRAMIEDALKELRYFMNQVEGYYSDTETGYELFIMTGDGDFLIEVLKKGLRYEELWRDRKIDIMDMQNSKYNEA